MHIEKPKLRRGLAYVLKSSLLEAALQNAQIDCETSLTYWMPQSGGSVLQAFLWTPSPRFDHFRLYIRAGAVPAAERKAAAIELERSVLPVFAAWASALLALPANAPVLYTEPMFDATWSDGRITMASHPASIALSG
jgi:hypothetical protein